MQHKNLLYVQKLKYPIYGELVQVGIYKSIMIAKVLDSKHKAGKN
jgi:hypothetical protein